MENYSKEKHGKRLEEARQDLKKQVAAGTAPAWAADVAGAPHAIHFHDTAHPHAGKPSA